MKLSIFTLIYVSAVVGLIFQFFLYYKREEIKKLDVGKSKAIQIFIYMVLAGLAIRALFFVAIKGYDSDLSCFIAWGNQLIEDGPASFYTAPGHEWYDYPPGYMLILGAIAFICKVCHFTYDSFMGKFIYLIPAIVADMVNALLLYKLGTKKEQRSLGLLMAAFVIFNPAIFFISGAWGQIDSILTLFLLLTLICVIKEKYLLMGLFYGLAIATKWQALILGPVLVIALVVFHDYKSKKENLNILKMCGGAGISLMLIALLSLIFRGDQPLLWIIDRFTNSTLGYNYATIEAYNFMALAGANWTDADTTFFLSLTYKAFGTIMITGLGLVTFIFTLADRAYFKSDYKAMIKRIFLHATFFMFGVFTFGHYMHERYIFPVLVLMLACFILEEKKDLLICSALLSSVVFINEMTALYVVKPQFIDAVRMSTPHLLCARICGLLEVACFAYFFYIYFTRNNSATSQDTN